MRSREGGREDAGRPNRVGGVSRLALVDLFAGCGGMTRGFEDSGEFRSVFAVEMDHDAAATYAANFGDHVACRRIEDVAAFPAADVVIGGPPCQGFSPLNREAVGFERRGLWRQYLRALEAIEPRAFVMENVPELLRSAEYAEFRRRAEALGFRVEGKVLNAADFGVPQRRRRAIVIGLRADATPWPIPTHADPSTLVAERATSVEDVGEGRRAWVTFREAVEGLALRPDGRRWHRPRRPRPESVRRYKAVPRDGGDRFAMQRNLDRAGLGHLVPRCWRQKPTGTTDVFGRLWWDRPALTIRTEFYKPEKGRYLHPSAHRPITVREAARLMSFPDDFVLPEDQAMSSVARQVGNAVPPLLAHRIADALAPSLRSEAHPAVPYAGIRHKEQLGGLGAAAGGAHGGLDAVGGGGDVLVLPDPHHGPARRREQLVDLRVALPVAGQLLLPEGFVGARHRAVLGTGVPEAAIDVDGDLGRPEDQVGAARHALHRPPVDPVAEPPPVQLRAQVELRRGVPGPHPRHPLADARGRGRHRRSDAASHAADSRRSIRDPAGSGDATRATPRREVGAPPAGRRGDRRAGEGGPGALSA